MAVATRTERLAELQPYVERARTFSGWEHSGLDIRPLGAVAPWDYEATARLAASKASSVIDLGTGGGERFSRIAAGAPARLVATEEWGVNARVADARLRPLGIPLVWCDSTRLPFAAASFDLVLSRHEAIDVAEVDRVLMPGGSVIAQQVAPDYWGELRRFFPRMTVFPDHDRLYPEGFAARGYEVSMRTHRFKGAFGSLGDLVFMLLTAPWTIPEFDADADLDALLAVEEACRTKDGIVLSEGRYILEARKAT